MISRALIVGLLIAAGEVANGNIRVRYLQRKLGRRKGKRLSFLLGVGIFFFLAWLFLPWIDPETIPQCFLVGLVWVIIMTILDVSFGRFVFKLSWQKIRDDFNPAKGNLLGIGMVLLLCCPAIVFLLP
jgi:hypothetical protein